MPPKLRMVLRRPAARGGGALRRPAAAAPPGAPVGGPRALLGDLSVAELAKLQHLWIKKGVYFHKEVDVAGRLVGVRVDDGNIFIDLEATGTKDAGLLKALTAKKSRRLSIHVCPPDCGNVLSDEYLVHGREFEQIDPGHDPWYSNLLKVGHEDAGEADELASLRAEALARGEVSPREKRGKKKKDQKETEEKQEKKEKKRKASSDSEVVEVGQKPLENVFGGTGLDPNAKSRRKFLKKARKVGKAKKKKKKSSSASSSSGGDTSSSSPSSKEMAGGLFSSERRLKTIWRKYPGALAATSVIEARHSLMTSQGLLHDTEKKSMPPLALQYTRQQLSSNMSPPMLQEAVTVAACLDGLLLGKVAWTADILAQRLKSLEALSRGTHWSIARQLELIKADMQTITGEEEGRDAARAARDEEKLKQSLSKGGDQRSSSKGKKGKESKGSGKSGADDSTKGKGAGGRKDSKGEWQ